MKIKSKRYKIGINKEKIFQLLKEKYRLPPEFIFGHPFMKKKCEWITGKIDSDSFELTDFRFSKTGLKFLGKLIEKGSHIEVLTHIKFGAPFVIFQSIWIVFFLIVFFTKVSYQERLSILIIIIIGELGNYLLLSSMIKNFYRFFESLFIQKNIFIEADYSNNS